MGYFARTLDSVKNGVELCRGVRSRAAPKAKPATTAPPLAPATDSVPSAVEAPARASPESSNPSHLPRRDKGKQPTEDQQKKQKWADKNSDAPSEV